MTGLRDYERWHRQYDDPDSDLSWRLRTVQGHLAAALDRYPGPVRVLSSCSGDGRDLLEVHPVIAERARRSAAALAARVEVRTADAGGTDAYLSAVPAEIVLLVGIFGNISDPDLARTIATAPALCRPGATLLWTRGRRAGDRNDVVRARFAAAGFTELDYATLDTGGWPAVGVVRYDGPPVPLPAGERLFTFLR